MPPPCGLCSHTTTRISASSTMNNPKAALLLFWGRTLLRLHSRTTLTALSGVHCWNLMMYDYLVVVATELIPILHTEELHRLNEHTTFYSRRPEKGLPNTVILAEAPVLSFEPYCIPTAFPYSILRSNQFREKSCHSPLLSGVNTQFASDLNQNQVP